jgi:hypothetical protein
VKELASSKSGMVRPYNRPCTTRLVLGLCVSPACHISIRNYFVQIGSAPVVEYGSSVYCSLDKLQVAPKGKSAASRNSVLFPRIPRGKS